MRTKRHRSRCAAEDCRKLYRHADPRSQTCSDACKQRVYRARKKAAALFAEEQLEAERQDKWDRVRASMQAAARRERQVESNRQPAPAPAPAPSHTTAPPARTRYTHFQPLEPPAQTIYIKKPRPPMTPI